MARITTTQIQQINEVYLRTKNKAATAREVGVSAASVTKYIIPGYISIDDIVFNRFKEEIPLTCESRLITEDDWAPLCILMDCEKVGMEELRKEVFI